ncbi:MAG TPA: T9SS type A sorting domain-containing protein [Chitinophagales bacterium]|nr:T9SS type A sorting domain-containing protein [Chitinophagales bacterium]
MKTLRKITTAVILLLVVAAARAGFIPIITTTTSCTSNDASLTFTGSGIAGPYSIVITNGHSYYYFDSTIVSSVTVNNLTAGSYNVTTFVSGQYQTTATQQVITIANVVQLQAIVTNTSCPANAGVVSIIASNGALPYSYSWSNGSTAASINNLPGGHYGVTVTDANGCTAKLDTSVLSTSPVILSLATSGPACNPTLTASSTGGANPVNYVWNTGATTAAITNLVGNAFYSVTATDANGCSAAQGTSISTTVLTIDSTGWVAVAPTNCHPNGGSLSANVANGTAPYSYLWSTGSTAATLTNIPQGGYTVTVTDANNCTGTNYYYLGQRNFQAWISAISSPACNSSNGSLQGSSSNGTNPISYVWSTGATTSSISGLAPGNYQLTVTESSGCSSTASYALSSLPLHIDSVASNVVLPTCSGGTGSITVGTVNGTAPYTYVWNTGATTASISGMGAGSYMVTVTDANNCTGTGYYYLYYLNSIITYINPQNYPDCGSANGSIAAYAYYQYTQGSSFTYNWSNGASSQTISNLAVGPYTVTVTEPSGCSATASYSLTGIANFNINITTTPTACDTAVHSGSATAIVTGSFAPPLHYEWYTYDNNWQTQVIDTSQTLNNLGLLYYMWVQVTDGNGCSTSTFDSVAIYLDPSCFDHITGYAYYDDNSNCSMDNSEHGYPYCYVIVTAANGNHFYANTDSTGYYDIEVLPGTYTVQPQVMGYSTCVVNTCNYSYSDTFTATGQVSTGNNFAFSTGTPTYDLVVHMGYNTAMPGQIRQYWIYYANHGTVAVPNGVITFTHDPNITLNSTNPPYTSYDVNTHTITWNIVNNLQAGSGFDQQHRIFMDFQIPQNLSLGTPLTSEDDISPVANDCNPYDNHEYYVDPVSGSHDPNEKEVYPAGNLSAADTVLTYTIRFQNTGNAPATLVVVSDTLSSYLDPATVIPGASSNPYTYKMSGPGIITFTFEPIYLTDSATNVDSSKGFVTFTVHTKPNIALGTQIKNTAYIYFDLNPAVVTNTTVSTRSNTSGIATIANQVMSARVMPNPAQSEARIEFTGATGKIVLKITDELGNVIANGDANGNIYRLDAASLSPGIYFYTANDAAGNRATGRISIVR